MRTLSNYLTWLHPEHFVHILSSGQQKEQCEANVPTFHPSQALPRLLPELTVFTEMERTLWMRQTGLSKTFPVHANVTFDTHTPFMVYLTVPAAYFTFMRTRIQSGESHVFDLKDLPYCGPALNFAFSPRSSLLLYAFSLSISQSQGQNFPWTLLDTAVTFGFRLPLNQWQTDSGTLKGAVWNRYYLDFFCHFSSEPITLSRGTSEMLGTLATMITFEHQSSILALVNYFANFRYQHSGWYMAMHVPIPENLWQVIQNTPNSGLLHPALLNKLYIRRARL